MLCWRLHLLWNSNWWRLFWFLIQNGLILRYFSCIWSAFFIRSHILLIIDLKFDPFKNLSSINIEVWLPKLHNCILSSSCKIISISAESGCCWWAFMPVESIHNCTFSKVPNLDCGILRSADEVVSRRMKIYWVYCLCVSIVMLE